MNINDIALPGGVRETTENGAFEVRYDLSVVETSKKLKEQYGKVERNESILVVPNEMQWSEITEFYEEKLKSEGFVRDRNAVEHQKNYQTAIWKRKNWLNEQAVAVILIEDKSYKPNSLIKMRAVCRA